MTQIEHVPLFAALPPEQTAAIVASLQPREYPAGTLLFNEGDIGDRLYIVLSGEIAIFKQLDAGEERPLGARGAGEFVGEMSFLSVDGRRTAGARVADAARTLELTREDFEALLQEHPRLAYEMLRIVSDRLRDANNTSIRDLRAKNHELAQAYAELQAAQAQLVERERFAHEMQLAREIQQTMHPTRLPQHAAYEVGARIVSAREVAGDFYDVFALDGDRLAVVVGDVCGKGVPSALYMAQARGLIRVAAQYHATPEATLHSVNKHLLELSDSGGVFVTVIMGVLHGSTRELTIARAGHERPIRSSAGRFASVPSGVGHPLGLLPDPAIDSYTLALAPGDAVLLFTDGVTEATDESGAFFESERLLEVVRNDVPAQDLCDLIVAAVARFRGSAPQADDITLLALRAV
jgi:phosphoserine phosphatase RsbU/P